MRNSFVLQLKSKVLLRSPLTNTLLLLLLQSLLLLQTHQILKGHPSKDLYIMIWAQQLKFPGITVSSMEFPFFWFHAFCSIIVHKYSLYNKILITCVSYFSSPEKISFWFIDWHLKWPDHVTILFLEVHNFSQTLTIWQTKSPLVWRVLSSSGIFLWLLGSRISVKVYQNTYGFSLF